MKRDYNSDSFFSIHANWQNSSTSSPVWSPFGYCGKEYFTLWSPFAYFKHWMRRWVMLFLVCFVSTAANSIFYIFARNTIGGPYKNKRGKMIFSTMASFFHRTTKLTLCVPFFGVLGEPCGRRFESHFSLQFLALHFTKEVKDQKDCDISNLLTLYPNCILFYYGDGGSKQSLPFVQACHIRTFHVKSAVNCVLLKRNWTSEIIAPYPNCFFSRPANLNFSINISRS